MAKREATNEESLPIIYNVTQTVGLGSDANRKDDVLLVQFFLSEIYEHAQMFDPPLVLPDSQPLKIDGIAGKTTRAWIRHFQSEGCKRGFALHVDSRVHSAKGFIGGIHGHIYTIIRLNGAFKKARPDVYDDLAAYEGTPHHLRGILK